MPLRTAIALAFAAGLLAAWLALYRVNADTAWIALAAAVVGGLAARLYPSALSANDESSRADDSARVHAGGATPNVASAVAAGEVPATALLEVTMDSMREAVVIIDSAMRVVALNNSARAAFRQGGADALSPRRLSDLTRNSSIYSAFAAAVARGERAEVKVETNVGEGRHVYDLHVAPLRQREVIYGSDVRGAVGVFFDITRLERLELVRQEFLSNVSHELRTPLTAILTFVETLEDGALDEPETARRFLSVIRRNAERMRTLVEEIMELSSIESGATDVDVREVRVFPAVQETFGALAAKAETCGVALVNRVSPESNVYADARRLEQMLLNLVDNAIKFSRRGGSVTVTHERGARDLICINDTGEGIPPEHLPRIFERFYRVDRARSREMGGTGLGLAIVKHLARAHGGEVRVRSTLNEGSTFTIELPRPQPE
ncbi:MAG: two-component system, OmpR family, phosphate regulon sensor histidine kinase PhoR [Acidobacteriota bacterium]|jgi:two-component system phosphate regulon sensor histidine kinase PhoR|nr:two-component system, OmpR family, phosphate regulon sensor histidine kinase PhoR [Acidobacteriota bacterium]